MAEQDDFGPLAFFKAQQQAYAEVLRKRRDNGGLIDGLMIQAYDSFERNVEIQAEGMPEPACRKGCAICCTLRVIATAPEVLMIGRYVRWSADQLGRANIDLAGRIVEADDKTRGLDDVQRVKLRLRCPYIHNGVCLIYRVRPLACRGHVSYDVRACVDAAAGRAGEVPYSLPHMTVRSLVQNALQSALRDAGLAFGLYELNQAVRMALDDARCERAWLAGEDVFAPAAINELSIEEMTRTYDAIHAYRGHD